MAFPRGAMGLSAVCDCGISGSHSLTFLQINCSNIQRVGLLCIFPEIDCKKEIKVELFKKSSQPFSWALERSFCFQKSKTKT